MAAQRGGTVTTGNLPMLLETRAHAHTSLHKNLQLPRFIRPRHPAALPCCAQNRAGTARWVAQVCATAAPLHHGHWPPTAAATGTGTGSADCVATNSGTPGRVQLYRTPAVLYPPSPSLPRARPSAHTTQVAGAACPGALAGAGRGACVPRCRRRTVARRARAGGRSAPRAQVAREARARALHYRCELY